MEPKVIKCTGQCYLAKDAAPYLRKIGRASSVVYDVSDVQTFSPIFAYEIMQKCEQRKVNVSFIGTKYWEDAFLEALAVN